MAFQNITGTPRFYIDATTWLRSIGAGWEQYSGVEFPGRPPFYGLNPTNPFIFHETGNQAGLYFVSTDDIPSLNLNFFAVLGHDFGYNAGYSQVRFEIGKGADRDLIQTTTALNWNENTGTMANATEYSGYSIAHFDKYEKEFSAFAFLVDYAPSGVTRHQKIGKIAVGTYFDLPRSPDLRLTMSRESGGTKHLRTKNGSYFSNSFHHTPPLWGDAPPWELYQGLPDQNNLLFSRGRRIWDLNWSFLQNDALFPMLNSVFPYESTSADGDIYSSGDNWPDGNMINDANSFYNLVVHRLNGGELPFIFQQDNSNNRDYAIAKLDMKSFKITQQSSGLYSLKLKIREVW